MIPVAQHKTYSDKCTYNTRQETSKRQKLKTGSWVSKWIICSIERRERHQTEERTAKLQCRFNGQLTVSSSYESILQNVLFEKHQIKQQQIDSTADINDKLNNLYSRQEDMQISISNVSSNVLSSIDRCCSNIKDWGEAKKKTPDKSNDVTLEISSLKKKVETSFDTVRSSIKSVETSVSTLRCGMTKCYRTARKNLKQ